MATRKRPLRAVEAGEKPSARVFESLIDAVEHGTHLDVLIWQRRDVAEAIKTEKGPALAALHRQLTLLSKEIESLQDKQGDDEGGGAGVGDETFSAEAL